MNRESFLLDTIQFYSTISNRAINQDSGLCEYKTPEGKKCAIGRFIADDQYSPDFEGSSIDEESIEILEALPTEVSSLGVKFLMGVQTLHDIEGHWNMEEGGLSDNGKTYVNNLIDTYNLSMPKYE